MSERTAPVRGRREGRRRAIGPPPRPEPSLLCALVSDLVLPGRAGPLLRVTSRSPFDHAGRYLVVQGRRPTWPMALLIDTEARTVKSQLKSTALVIPVGVTWPQHFRRTPDYRAPSAACSPRPSSEKTKERGQRPPWPARVQGGNSGLGRANGVQPGTHEAPFLLQG